MNKAQLIAICAIAAAIIGLSLNANGGYGRQTARETTAQKTQHTRKGMGDKSKTYRSHRSERPQTKLQGRQPAKGSCKGGRCQNTTKTSAANTSSSSTYEFEE